MKTNTQRKFIFVITGYSRAGKDSTADALTDLLDDSIRIKFAAPAKRAFEDWFDLPTYSLESERYKNACVVSPATGETNYNVSYLDVLRSAFYKWDEIYPGLTVGKAMRNASSDANLLFTDIRKQIELDAVIAYSKKHNMPICLLHVCRDGVTKVKGVDDFVDDMLYLDFESEYYRVLNNGSIEELEARVELYLNEFLKPYAKSEQNSTSEVRTDG